MVKGLGTDIIEIERIRKGVERHGLHFLNKLFTPKEQEYCGGHRDPFPCYAGRFSAKEAIVKALGSGFRAGVSWLDIEILNDEQGKPYVTLSPALQERLGRPHILITISHCRDYATATAIWS